MTTPKLSEAEVENLLIGLRADCEIRHYNDFQLEEAVRVQGALTCSRSPNSALHRRRIAALDIVLAERRERKEANG